MKIGDYVRTKEIFKDIKGYEEVVAVMELEGTLSSDISAGSYSMKIYYWYGEDEISNTTISFINGKVSSKSQIGLK